MKPKIIAFAGSLRKDSYNKKLVNIAVKQAEKLNAKVDYIELADYPLPLFDEDIESLGTPDNLIKLRDKFHSADALLIASPEYNGSFSAVLKNTLDWLSRPASKDENQVNFSKLTVGLMAASPGKLGGIRGLSHIREIMSNLGSLVIPDSLAISAAYNAFDDQGQLKDKDMEKRLATIVHKTVSLSSR